MGIERDGIGPLQSAQRLPAALRQNGRGAKRAIGMQPHLVARAKIAQLGQGIDRAGVGRAGVGDDTKWAQAGLAIDRDRLDERLHGQTEFAVGRKFSHLFRGKTDDPQRAFHRRVCLVREINGGAVDAILQNGVPRGQQSGHVGDGAAAHEKASRGFGEAAPLAEPANDFELEGGGGRAPEPGSIEDVEAGGERVGHGADEIVGPGHEREKTWMIDVKIVGKNIAFQPGQKLVGIDRSFSGHPGEKGAESFGINFRSDRTVAHSGEVFGEQIDHAVAELAHFLRRKFEACRINRGFKHWIIAL